VDLHPFGCHTFRTRIQDATDTRLLCFCISLHSSSSYPDHPLLVLSLPHAAAVLSAALLWIRGKKKKKKKRTHLLLSPLNSLTRLYIPPRILLYTSLEESSLLQLSSFLLPSFSLQSCSLAHLLSTPPPRYHPRPHSFCLKEQMDDHEEGYYFTGQTPFRKPNESALHFHARRLISIQTLDRLEYTVEEAETRFNRALGPIELTFVGLGKCPCTAPKAPMTRDTCGLLSSSTSTGASCSFGCRSRHPLQITFVSMTR